ncbi:hypothetical protein [Aminobacter sp. LjRoot7]|uniref:hypothetical protein n=1 Tax=Aminobacter sp. LjRoot7 TaxID=3342335 RepID=UPI003ECF5983
MHCVIIDRPVVHLVAQATDLTNRAGSYTFAGLGFGDDFTNRTLVAIVHMAATSEQVLNQTSCTIGGVAASGADSGDADNSPAGAAATGIWAAKPSGTSGSVVINFTSGTATAAAIYLYAVTDVASAGPFAYSAGSGGAGGITSDPTFPASPTGTINIPNDAVHGAVLIGGATRANNTGAITLNGITQAYDVTLDGVHRIAGGFDFRLPQQTNRPIGFSTGSGNVIFGMKAASFS